MSGWWWLIVLASGLSLWVGVTLVLDTWERQGHRRSVSALRRWYRSRRLAGEAEAWLRSQ